MRHLRNIARLKWMPLKLEGWNVSLIVMSGMTFDLSTPYDRMMATFLSCIAELERDLISERVKLFWPQLKLAGKSSADKKDNVRNQIY